MSLKMGECFAIEVSIPMGVFVTTEVVVTSKGSVCTTCVFVIPLVVSFTDGSISITKQGGVSSPPIDKWEGVSLLSSNCLSLSIIGL